MSHANRLIFAAIVLSDLRASVYFLVIGTASD